MDFFDLVPSQFLCQGLGLVARQHYFDRPAGLFADGLGGGQGLERNPVQLTFPLFSDDQDPIGHLLAL